MPKNRYFAKLALQNSGVFGDREGWRCVIFFVGWGVVVVGWAVVVAVGEGWTRSLIDNIRMYRRESGGAPPIAKGTHQVVDWRYFAGFWKCIQITYVSLCMGCRVARARGGPWQVYRYMNSEYCTDSGGEAVGDEIGR